MVTLKLQLLNGGTLKLRYSSISFSKRLPSWPVPKLSRSPPVAGASPGPRFHFPDRDLVNERPAKRFRITGKSSADKRARVASGDIPTPKRRKRSVPHGTGRLRDEVGAPPQLFPRIGVG